MKNRKLRPKSGIIVTNRIIVGGCFMFKRGSKEQQLSLHDQTMKSTASAPICPAISVRFTVETVSLVPVPMTTGKGLCLPIIHSFVVCTRFTTSSQETVGDSPVVPLMTNP